MYLLLSLLASLICTQRCYPFTELRNKVQINEVQHVFFFFVLELTRFCSYPLGLQSGGVKDAQITASSIWDKYHQPYFGRLKRVRKGRNVGGWAARHNNQNQWIQFDLRRILKITMVSTQGRKIVKQWVTRYTISHSIDCVHFVPYKEKDRLKVRTFFP